MLIYWLLLAFPAVMTMTYPVQAPRNMHGSGQTFAFGAFVLVYTLIGGLRYETGGDWLTYGEMFEDIRLDTLNYAMTNTDSLYGLLNWLSAQLGAGLQLVNVVCCFILACGVVRVARLQREPWQAILIAVPYLMIVVGFGYVRQAAAIGLMLLALANIDNRRPVLSLAYLGLAVLFHSTAALMIPFFIFALTRRNQLLALVLTLLGSIAFVFILAPRLGTFEVGYLDAEYDSSGTAARLVMSLLPSLLILFRWKHFVAGPKARLVWLLIAIANLVAVVALVFSPSSTAVDRIALFFSVIQMAAFGEFRDLSGTKPSMAPLLRLMLIAIAIAVQSVWLMFGTHALFWVPYRSVLELL